MRLMILGFLLHVLPALCVAQGFHAVHSSDGSKVWAVGDAGNVFISTNGGANWASYTHGNRTLRSVWTLGNNVWIVGDHGTIQRSTNAGSTWNFTSLQDSVDLTSVVFVSTLRGWIGGRNGLVMRTDDGGATWSAQDIGSVRHVAALAFADSLIGYVVGSSGLITQTLDGGATWEVLRLESAVEKDLLDVDVWGDIVYVTGVDGRCYMSENAGRTWKPLDFMTDSQSDVTGVHAISEDRAFFIGGGGYIRQTTNRGSSFTWGLHGMHARLSDIHFLSGTHGWAVSDKNRAVLRTSDGGATWSLPAGTTVNTSWTQKLTASASIGNTFMISPIEKNKLYVALGRFIYMSTDLGETWSQTATISSSGGSTHSFYISPKDTNHYVVAFTGGGDRIMKSTDRGQTWTSTIVRNFSAFGMPLEMDASHPDTLIFGPEDGYLYRSTDFGSTWTAISQPGFNSPCDIQIVRDSATIIWVGDSGPSRISRSTNGGLTFSVVYDGGAAEIPTMANSSLQNNIGYATAWSSGGLQKTSDHGANWSTSITTGSTWGVDVAKDDPNVVMFGVYGGGTSYLSANGGASFSTASLSGSNYAILAYDRATFFAQQSGGVWKYNFAYSVPASNVQAVTIVSPSGGEVWQYGTTQQIRWTSSNLTNVRIEFRSAPGEPWQNIVANTAASTGSYSWSVPALNTSQAVIRISDAADGNPSDSSATPFSITSSAIAVNPTNLSFGDVGVGEGGEETLFLTNEGTGTLVVFSATTTTTYFVPGRTTFTIAPGQADTLSVRFLPEEVQAYIDTLVLTTNAPGGSVAIPLAGAGVPVLSVGEEVGVPSAYALDQNYPNPFNPTTAISYALPVESRVSLRVFNTLGQEIEELVNEIQPPGRYTVRFPSLRSGDLTPSGVYFYRFQAGDFTSMRKMILLK